VLAPLAVLVYFIARAGGAPQMYAGLTRWWAPLLLLWTAGFAIATAVALWRRNFRLARAAAIGEVTLVLVGWGSAQFPNVIVPDVSIYDGAAPEATLRLLVMALAAGGLVLFPSLLYLFHVFKSRSRQ
jgi:cytochrome d ubiquinol oxidase subunit II